MVLGGELSTQQVSACLIQGCGGEVLWPEGVHGAGSDPEAQEGMRRGQVCGPTSWVGRGPRCLGWVGEWQGGQAG